MPDEEPQQIPYGNDKQEELAGTSKLTSVKGQMLPGIAGICMFMIFMTIVNVYGGLHGAFGSGVQKYGILTLCSLLALGIYGLLRLRKWGWALVIAGCLLMSLGDSYFFVKSHVSFFMVRGLFSLLFFLYLARQETRERLV
jgi:hypothetical protein